MTNEDEDDNVRLEKLRTAIASSHRTGGSVEPNMHPSHEAVRRKAYELWERGGRINGGDLDDWFQATTMLTQAKTESLAEVAPADPQSHSAVKIISDGLQAAMSIAAGAAHTVTGLFVTHDGSEKPEDDRRKP